MLSYNFTRFHLWVNISVKKTVIFTKNFLKFSKKMIFFENLNFVSTFGRFKIHKIKNISTSGVVNFNYDNLFLGQKILASIRTTPWSVVGPIYSRTHQGTHVACENVLRTFSTANRSSGHFLCGGGYYICYMSKSRPFSTLRFKITRTSQRWV